MYILQYADDCGEGTCWYNLFVSKNKDTLEQKKQELINYHQNYIDAITEHYKSENIRFLQHKKNLKEFLQVNRQAIKNNKHSKGLWQEEVSNTSLNKESFSVDVHGLPYTRYYSEEEIVKETDNIINMISDMSDVTKNWHINHAKLKDAPPKFISKGFTYGEPIGYDKNSLGISEIEEL
jgi:hypothetical protein